MGSLPRHTKEFSDFDETYSVCRAFNSKNICKKSGPFKPLFDRGRTKILLPSKPEKRCACKSVPLSILRFIPRKQAPKVTPGHSFDSY